MIVAFSVSPLGVGEDVGEDLADAVRVVRESGPPNRTDAGGRGARGGRGQIAMASWTQRLTR